MIKMDKNDKICTTTTLGTKVLGIWRYGFDEKIRKFRIYAEAVWKGGKSLKKWYMFQKCCNFATFLK